MRTKTSSRCQVPRRSNHAGSDVGGNCRTEFQNPSANGFIAYINTVFCQQFLDVPKAQRKAKMEPDHPPDYCRRKSMMCVGYIAHSRTITCRSADRRANVTMPPAKLGGCPDRLKSVSSDSTIAHCGRHVEQQSAEPSARPRAAARCFLGLPPAALQRSPPALPAPTTM